MIPIFKSLISCIGSHDLVLDHGVIFMFSPALTLLGWQEELTKQWKSLPVFVVGKATSQAGRW